MSTMVESEERGRAMRQGSVARRRGAALSSMVVAAVLVACTPSTGGSTTTTTPGGNHAPAIGSFTPSRGSSPAPLTAAFSWTISDADGDALTCALDFNNDGLNESTINGCTSASLRSASFSTVGSTTVRLRVSDGVAESSTTTTVTVTAPAADQFTITLRLNGSMTPSQSSAFTAAANRWAQVVRTGLTDLSLSIPADDCETGAPAFTGSVDDVLIDATIGPIDGVGGTLGQAGPCLTRSSTGLPVYGAMEFDVADVAALEAAGDFNDVILHEMGHVLGFGTVWTVPLLTGVGTSNPEFNGLVARGAYQAIGGTGAVPVENSGGSGTINSHWRETTFNNELMTGYLDAGVNPLSRLTVGSLGDLGYGVDLNAADAYGLPALRGPSATTPEPARPEMELFGPHGSV